jgi:DNA-directed RNA polymerase subunit RPC12/RpoP
MALAKTARVACSRCGSESVGASRQIPHFFTKVYCATFRRQRYRCFACNSRFYGRRRHQGERRSEDPGVAHQRADSNGAT